MTHWVMDYQSHAAPAPERIQGIASSARAWLVSLLERIPARGDIAVRALCHVLIATWIADTMADTNGAKPEGMLAQHADETSDFNRVYHTTLVAILAGTVLLSRSRLCVSTAPISAMGRG